MTAIGKVESVADLGALIRQARQAAGMTQEELADQMGTTRNWMIRMEQGRCTVSMKMALIALSELGLEMTAGINLHSKNKLSESNSLRSYRPHPRGG